MATTTTVRVLDCTGPTDLFRQYHGQSEPQPAYLELDLRDGTLRADYDSEVGPAAPAAVHHGFERRWGIPLLTGEAANRVMAEIHGLAGRILADFEEHWDGRNTVARLGEDAQAAEDEIRAWLGPASDSDRETTRLQDQGFPASDLVGVWDVYCGVLNGYEAEEHGITAETTDARLAEIAAEILSGLAGTGDHPVAVCAGLAAHLGELRDEAKREAPESVVWSVVRGESPTARAVEPGLAGVTIPDDVLEWAAGHGLGVDDPDVYLLVTPEDEAGEVPGEVACTTAQAPDGEVASLRTAIAAL